jgi:hypothetical protein
MRCPALRCAALPCSPLAACSSGPSPPARNPLRRRPLQPRSGPSARGRAARSSSHSPPAAGSLMPSASPTATLTEQVPARAGARQSRCARLSPTSAFRCDAQPGARALRRLLAAKLHRRPGNRPSQLLPPVPCATAAEQHTPAVARGPQCAAALPGSPTGPSATSQYFQGRLHAGFIPGGRVAACNRYLLPDICRGRPWHHGQAQRARAGSSIRLACSRLQQTGSFMLRHRRPPPHITAPQHWLAPAPTQRLLVAHQLGPKHRRISAMPGQCAHAPHRTAAWP